MKQSKPSKPSKPTKGTPKQNKAPNKGKNAEKTCQKPLRRRNIKKGKDLDASLKREAQLKKNLSPLVGTYVDTNRVGRVYITRHGIQETAYHARKSERSTAAATHVVWHLKKTTPTKREPAGNRGRRKQMKLEEMIVGHSKPKYIKVVLGVEKGYVNKAGRTVLYCITDQRSDPNYNKKKKE